MQSIMSVFGILAVLIFLMFCKFVPFFAKPIVAASYIGCNAFGGGTEGFSLPARTPRCTFVRLREQWQRSNSRGAKKQKRKKGRGAKEQRSWTAKQQMSSSRKKMPIRLLGALVILIAQRQKSILWKNPYLTAQSTCHIYLYIAQSTCQSRKRVATSTEISSLQTHPHPQPVSKLKI